MINIKEKLKGYSLSSISLIAFTLLLIFLPKSVSTIGNIPIRLTCIILFCFIIGYDIFINKIEIRSKKQSFIIIVSILFLISTIPSLFHSKALITSIYTFLKFFSSFVLLFLLLKIKFKPKEIKLFKKVLIICLNLLCILGICQYIFKVDLFKAGIEYYSGAKGRIDVTFFNTIYYGMFLNLFFPIILYLFFKANKKINKIILLITLALMYINLLLTFTRSSFILFSLIYLFMILLLYKKSFKIRTLLLTIIVITATVTISGGKTFIKKSLDDGLTMISSSSIITNFLPTIENNDSNKKEEEYLDFDENSEFSDYSLQHREEFAKIAKKVANEHLYTGVGFGAYIDYMKSDDFKKNHPEYKLSLTHPHSSFVLLFSEVGIYGLIIFIIFLLVLFIPHFINFINSFKKKDKFYDLNITMLATLTAFIIVNVISENAVYDAQIFPLFIIIYSLLECIIEDNKKKNVLFISSTGGHLSELLQLKSIFKKYDYHLITEKTKSTLNLKSNYKNVCYLMYGTKDHKFSYIFKFTFNCIKSLILFIKIKPSVIVTTGTHTAVPICYIGKIFGSRIIFIETFANSKTKTLSGRLIYPISDTFIVQWKEMLNLYPKAIYGGWIY